jgi:hypothetical protein
MLDACNASVRHSHGTESGRKYVDRKFETRREPEDLKIKQRPSRGIVATKNSYSPEEAEQSR